MRDFLFKACVLYKHYVFMSLNTEKLEKCKLSYLGTEAVDWRKFSLSENECSNQPKCKYCKCKLL